MRLLGVVLLLVGGVFGVLGLVVDDGASVEASRQEVLRGLGLGEVVGVLSIPAIGVERVVVEGVGVGVLEGGPGMYPGTALPGLGNTVIAGHRTTFGAPFRDLGVLKPGDLVELLTVRGLVSYRVVDTVIVDPDDMAVTRNFGDVRVTLTACHPKGSRSQRIVVQAVAIDL